MTIERKRPNKVTSLWKVVEAMQRVLEGEGLDDATVDKAVTLGLAELLSPSYETSTRPAAKVNGSRPQLAIAKV